MVVPTWNLCDSPHAYGTIEFFNDADRLLDVVTRPDQPRGGAPRRAVGAVTDAPPNLIDGMLKGVFGFAIQITRIEGKWKMSQNRPFEDRAVLVSGLTEDRREAVAALDQRRPARSEVRLREELALTSVGITVPLAALHERVVPEGD